MRISAWLVSLFFTFILSQSAMADTPVVPYSGTWSGTIGTSKVQVFFSEDAYDANYYYIKHKSPIRLERSEKDPSEWNENIGHWEPKITGIWKLEQVSANSIKGVWINPDTKDKLPIELKRIAAIVKDKNGYVDMSAFYAPIINSLNYHYGAAKLGDTEYEMISTDSGVAFELPSTMKNVQKLNKYAREWVDGQSVASYDCQLSGGGGWQRSLTPQFIIGDFLIIEDNLQDTFCGGAHGTWNHTHIVYDLNKGDFVDTRSWIKDFEKTSYGDNEGKTKFRALIESLNSRSEEDSNFFSLDAPYPTKEGLVFHTLHPYVTRACDENITVPYKEMAPYLTLAGKKAIYPISPTTFLDNLCKKNEKIIFNCATENDKIISICASEELSKEKGYLQYRFGTKNDIELIYPSSKEGTQGLFYWSEIHSYGIGDYSLSFINKGYIYTVEYGFSSEEMSGVSGGNFFGRVYIKKENDPAFTKTLNCLGNPQGNFPSLWGVVNDGEYLFGGK